MIASAKKNQEKSLRIGLRERQGAKRKSVCLRAAQTNSQSVQTGHMVETLAIPRSLL
jgi:hypothetical protein